MTTEINKLLERICRKLSRGDVANYVADIKIFHCCHLGINAIDAIRKMLGAGVEVGNIEKSNLTELIEIAKEGFYFKGDECSHPNRNYLLSEEFKLEVNEVLEQISLLFSDSLEIFILWLKEGHPFYPVYWDYAFLIRKNPHDFLFIGSSSD